MRSCVGSQKSFTGDGTGAANVTAVAYLTGAKDIFPHVNMLPDRDPPKFPGNGPLLQNSKIYATKLYACASVQGGFKEFAAGKGDAVSQQLRNKVKKCPECGKPNAFLLCAVCRLCAISSLTSTPKYYCTYANT